MLSKRYILFMLCAMPVAMFAQKTSREYLRSGNKLYRDSLFVKAEVDYRKAIDKDPNFTDALYNLGNSTLMQQKAKEAMEQFESLTRIEKDKSKLAEIYHNMGVILQSSKQLPQCIEAYKNALRNNPKDNETRYNLALAMKQLKDQQQQQNEQDKQQQDKQQQDKQEQNKDQQKNNKDKQQDQQKNQQQQQQKQNQMSKENAEQMLQAIMQDEKNVQDKVKKQIQVRGKKLEKDW